MERAYYLITPGTLSRKDNSITVVGADGIQKKDIPVESVYDLYSFTDLNFNSDVMEFLGRKGICVHFFDYYGNYNGSFFPREKLVSGNLVVNQAKFYLDNEKRTFLAKQFVFGSAKNIVRNLRYYTNRGKNLDREIETIELLQEELLQYNDVESIMGIEGNIRKTYYSCWNTIIDVDFSFEKRIKRPPTDVVNTLISFMNGVIYAKTLTEIYKTQLNPTVSFLHEPGVKRFSLALDVSEIFKPLIVDRTIFSLLNKKMLDETDFNFENNLCLMKSKGIKTVMTALEESLNRTILHKKLGKEVSYRHLIRLELYKIIKHILNEQEYEPFKIWW